MEKQQHGMGGNGLFTVWKLDYSGTTGKDGNMKESKFDGRRFRYVCTVFAPDSLERSEVLAEIVGSADREWRAAQLLNRNNENWFLGFSPYGTEYDLQKEENGETLIAFGVYYLGDMCREEASGWAWRFHTDTGFEVPASDRMILPRSEK